MKNKIKKFFLDLFFPRFCLGCQKEGAYLCQDCKATLDVLQYNYCLCNKNPIRLSKAGKCKRCSTKKLLGLYFPLAYEENPLTKKLIQNFKYEPYLKELANTFSDLIIEHFLLLDQNPQKIWQKSILVPIPLGKRKLKKRGFNQAEEIARELSKILKIPLISNNLVKIKTTLPQVDLSEKERQKNLIDAFSCKNPEKIKEKKILLVDDVYTTGATMEEASKVLKEAGAKEVWGVVIAREG